MFLLKWIRNKFASRHQEDPPPSDTEITVETPDMAMRKIGKVLKDVNLVPTNISVTLDNDSIELIMGWKINVKYVDRGGDYCTVELNGYTKNSEETTKKINYHKNFLDVFFIDFSAILQISKLSLRYLEISIDDHPSRTTRILFWIRSRLKNDGQLGVPDKTTRQLFANYQKIMNFFDAHPMTIKSLQITGLGDSQISKFLSKIKTEELSIQTTFGGAESLDFGKIVKLGNWESIKELRLSDFSVLHPVTLFIDKPTLYMKIDKISIEEIRLIVKTFRNNPSMESWNLFFKDHLDVKNLLVRELGQPSQRDEWYFNVPGSGKVFNVSIRWKGTLEFHYLNRDKVPEGVEIQ